MLRGSDSTSGVSGTHTRSLLGKPNRGGITPTTVWGRVLMKTRRPMIGAIGADSGVATPHR